MALNPESETDATIEWIEANCVCLAGPAKGSLLKLTAEQKANVKYMFETLQPDPSIRVCFLDSVLGVCLMLYEFCDRAHSRELKISIDTSKGNIKLVDLMWETASPALRSALDLQRSADRLTANRGHHHLTTAALDGGIPA